jgi:excisionase family DNA binding protein
MSTDNHVINLALEGERAYKIEQAAFLLSLSPHTVRKYVQEGRIKSTKLGSRRVVLSSTIAQILREGLPQA